MQVKKRNGCMEEVSFDKVIFRIKPQCQLPPVCISVDYISIAQKVCEDVLQIYFSIFANHFIEILEKHRIANF